MLRFIMILLGKKYESEVVEVLKQQLAIANEEKKLLTDTLLSILQPKAYHADPVELKPTAPASALFSRRRAAMEARDREEAKLKQTSTLLQRPDTDARSTTPIRAIETLEQELGIQEEMGEAQGEIKNG